MLKRVLSLFMSFSLIFCLTACKQDNPDILVNIDNYNYTEDIKSYAVKLNSIKENNSGFCIVGSDADKEKADYIESVFNEIGLQNVRQENVETEGWVHSDISIEYPCNCGDNAFLTMRRVGVYPSEFNYMYSNLPILCMGEEVYNFNESYINGSGVIFTYTDNQDLIDKVNYCIENNAAFIIYKSNMQNKLAYLVDIVLDLPYDIPIFVISSDNYTSFMKNKNIGEIVNITINGYSELKESVDSPFVIGEIEGKNKDKFIYVTANRDSVDSGFYSANVSVAEVIELAKIMIKEDYKPNYTIRFMITTGQEWGSKEESINYGIKRYIESIDLDSIVSVLVVDGSRPIKGQIETETQMANNDELYNKLIDYNEKFKENKYRFKNSILELNNENNTEALVWNEFKVPIVLQAEPLTSVYLDIENSSYDTFDIEMDKTQPEFLIKYYTGVIKIMNEI